VLEYILNIPVKREISVANLVFRGVAQFKDNTMTQAPVTVTYSLEQVLGQINEKLDDLKEDVTDIKLDISEIKGEIKTLEVELKGEIKTLSEEVKNIKEDVKELKGSTKNQIWTLIILLGTALIGTVIRFVITAMSHTS
jgi:peptidoglycan hydrolase CwlO-like protein